MFFASVRKRLKTIELERIQWHANEPKCAQVIEKEGVEWRLMIGRWTKNEGRDLVDEIFVGEKRGMAGQF